MKALTGLTLTGVLAAGAAGANPLLDLLEANNGLICYDRVYDAAHLARNPNQKTRSIRLSLTDYAAIDGASIRISINGSNGTRHIVGECGWSEEPNLDSMGEPYLASYKAGPGLVCHAAASTDGASAEEGGDFLVELRAGKNAVLHIPGEIAAWPSYETEPEATFFRFGVDDRVFRIDRTGGEACLEMNRLLPSAEDIYGPAGGGLPPNTVQKPPSKPGRP